MEGEPQPHLEEVLRTPALTSLMGLVSSLLTWEKAQSHCGEAKRAQEHPCLTDEEADLPGMAVNPRWGRGSQRLTGRQDPCGGAGRPWKKALAGVHSGSRWQVPLEQLGGCPNKGARGCDVSFCQSQKRSQLVTHSSHQLLQPPWRRRQDMRPSRAQMRGPLALSPDPQACCRHRQTGVSINFYYLARQPLVRCSIAERLYLRARGRCVGPSNSPKSPQQRELPPMQAQIISFDQR